MADFTAAEIARQSSRVKEQLVNVHTSCTNIYNDLESLQNIIQSEDSNLAASIKEYGQLYVELEKQLQSKFSSLTDVMDKWSTSTTSNETSTASSVDTMSKEIQSLKDSLGLSGTTGARRG